MTRALTWAWVAVGFVLAATPAHAAPRPKTSCYGPGLFGNLTADGTRLWADTVGVAHKTLPLGTKLRVRSGKHTITVKVIDRGPYVRGRNLDLTQAAVRRLGYADCTEIGDRPTRSWRAR